MTTRGQAQTALSAQEPPPPPPSAGAKVMAAKAATTQSGQEMFDMTLHDHMAHAQAAQAELQKVIEEQKQAQVDKQSAT